MTQIIPPIVVIGYPDGSGGGGSGGGGDTGGGYNTSTTNGPEWGSYAESKVNELAQKAIEIYGVQGGGQIKTLLEGLLASDRVDIINFIANHEIKLDILPAPPSLNQLGHSVWQSDSETGVALENTVITIFLNPVDINARIAYETSRYGDQWAISFAHELGHPLLGSAGSHATVEGSQNLSAWVKGVGYSAGMIADQFEATGWGAYFW